jgi:hypothetical protein
MTARAPTKTAHNSELHCKVTRLHLLTTRINSLRPTRAIMNRTCKFCCSPCCLSYLAQLSVLGAKASPRTFVAVVGILCERSKLKTTLLCTSLMMLLHIVLLLCGKQIYIFLAFTEMRAVLVWKCAGFVTARSICREVRDEVDCESWRVRCTSLVVATSISPGSLGVA